ncbi:acyl-CoA/acyl-ACP dehydrogenase [Duganella sp. FT3S]|uniref:Acyl-CoA/acyl-ACP dehydrogenase n=1 Tax=Rugamonas fusca TaxID=2758568 RepID=A0A7W2EE22_9BURK|nr:acyl-CoA dehydrogenase family protein [Rugamonas fusca]MBA5604237.1 acyl-CoA/acyl-ACP dehydrogenase [Rugamonas fusca]
MDLQLTTEQEMMATAARKMAAKCIEPVLRKHAASAPLPKAAMLEIYGALADFGLTAARLPTELGGGGLSMIDYGLMIEQLPPVIALSLISHEGTIMRIHAGATAEVRHAYLPDLIAGRKIACAANSEEAAGSDANAVRTRLEMADGHARITGRKMWISNASVCDVVVASCAAEADGGGRPRIRRALVDRSQSEIEVRAIELTGLKQGHLGELVFERTMVPPSHLMDGEGDAGKYYVVGGNGNRPLLGLMAVNMAQRAFDMAREYATVRQQFGQSLASCQLVQQDLAEIESAVISSRLMCLYALDCLDRGMRGDGTSAMAKRFATHHAERAVHLAMQVHGAMGISEELALEQLWRDVRVLQVPDGTMGILALIQARSLTGVAAFRPGMARP